MSYRYEWVRTSSTLFEWKECKSLEEAIGNAAAHISNGDGFPLKVLHDGKTVLDSQQLRTEAKTKFGV